MIYRNIQYSNFYMDKGLTELFEWVRAGAGYIHEGLCVMNISTTERSLFTKSEIPKGTILVRIPSRLCIFSEGRHDPNEGSPTSTHIKQTIMKLFAEMRNKNSPFRAYLNTLPHRDALDHLPIMNIQKNDKVLDAAMSINSDFVERITSMHQLINDIYEELNEGYPGISIEQYKIVAALYFSRSWKEFGLIPVIDLLQHDSNSQNMVIKTSDKRIVNEESICLIASETINANSEVTINYGVNTTLTDFYVYYGFTFETNRIPLYVNVNSNDREINKFINHELARCKIPGLYIDNTGVPNTLFQALRILHLTETDIKLEPVLDQYIKFIASSQEKKKALIMFDVERPDINYLSAISLTNEFKVFRSIMRLLQAGSKEISDDDIGYQNMCNNKVILMLKKIKARELRIYNYCNDLIKQQWIKMISE